MCWDGGDNALVVCVEGSYGVLSVPGLTAEELCPHGCGQLAVVVHGRQHIAQKHSRPVVAELVHSGIGAFEPKMQCMREQKKRKNTIKKSSKLQENIPEESRDVDGGRKHQGLHRRTTSLGRAP